jgi:NADH:ubiquinone oxidoreductase subunit 5 (subunit L)/multisubunit Na+/H+ antiporter MnhA subunit
MASFQRLLENKFYFDAVYDRLFYAPAAELATGLMLDVEEPVILQTGPDLGDTTLEAGALVRRIQTGFLRTYVLFLAFGAAAVVLAFLIAR